MTAGACRRRTNDWGGIDEFDRAGTGIRWSISFLVMAGLFAGLAWLEIHSPPDVDPPPTPPAETVTIDIEPQPAAALAPPTEAPPGPQHTQSEPPPGAAVLPTVPTPAPPVLAPEAVMPPAPPSLAPEVAIPLPPEPPPRPPAQHRPHIVARRPLIPHPDRRPPTPATTAPPELQPPAAPAPASAAPVPSVPGPSSNAVPTWQGRLLGRLEQFKRYPNEAQYRREQGVVYLHFAMDRNGKVLSARIEKSSGYDSLDQETLALIRRAEPLPKPPPEVPGDPVELTVPVQFFLR